MNPSTAAPFEPTITYTNGILNVMASNYKKSQSSWLSGIPVRASISVVGPFITIFTGLADTIDHLARGILKTAGAVLAAPFNMINWCISATPWLQGCNRTVIIEHFMLAGKHAFATVCVPLLIFLFDPQTAADAFFRLENECESYHSNPTLKTNKTKDATTVSLEARVDELKNENLKEILENTKKTTEQLTKALELSKSKKAEISVQLEAEVKALKAELNVKNAEAQKIRSKLGQISGELGEATALLEQVKAENESLKALLANQEQSLQDLQASLAEFREPQASTDTVKTREDIENLSAQIEDLQNRLRNTHEQLEEANEKLRNITEEKETAYLKYAAEKQTLENSLEKSKDAFEQLQQGKRTLETEIAEMNDAIQERKAAHELEISNLKMTIKTLQESLEKAHDTFKESKSITEQKLLTDKLASDQKTAALTKIMNEKTELRAKLVELNATVESQQRELDQLKEKIEEKPGLLSEDSEKQKAEIHKLSEEVRDLKRQLEAARAAALPPPVIRSELVQIDNNQLRPAVKIAPPPPPPRAKPAAPAVNGEANLRNNPAPVVAKTSSHASATRPDSITLQNASVNLRKPSERKQIQEEKIEPNDLISIFRQAIGGMRPLIVGSDDDREGSDNWDEEEIEAVVNIVVNASPDVQKQIATNLNSLHEAEEDAESQKAAIEALSNSITSTAPHNSGEETALANKVQGLLKNQNFQNELTTSCNETILRKSQILEHREFTPEQQAKTLADLKKMEEENFAFDDEESGE